MTEEVAPVVVVAIEISDPALADRLASLLGGVAGIRQGDIIVDWNGEKLSGVRALLRALGPDSVGSVVDVTIRRGGEPVQVKLTISERADA